MIDLQNLPDLGAMTQPPPPAPRHELTRVAPPVRVSNDSYTSILALTRIVQRQKWKLIAFIAVAMLAAVVLQFTLSKLYEASAEVKIDRHSAPGVIGQEAAQVSSVDDMDQIITTQMELAHSDNLLRPITEKYNLLEQEHQLKGLTQAQMALKRSSAIDLKQLKISRPPNTYLIKISYRAHSPQLAADVANAVADALVAHSNDTANRSYTEVAEMIAHDMVDLRAKMDQSAHRLVQYEKELNMVDPVQRTTILSARLAQLNAEYTTVQTDRLRKESIVEGLAAAHTLAAAQAAEADNPRSRLMDSLQRLDTARQQFATAQSYYGEDHPEYKKAKDQLREAQEQVDESRLDTNNKAKADYFQALAHEKSLSRLVERTKQEVDNLKESASQYEQLKMEAENDKRTYADLETRNREARVNEHFRDATNQIVAGARPPFEPIFPRLLINLPIAFILSLILGVIGAVIADLLDTTLSDPEEVATHFNMDVLASIPASRYLPPVGAAAETALQLAGGASDRAAQSAGAFGEAIRMLRNAMSLTALGKRVRTVLLTSANPSEGKSTTSTHLALSFAQVGKKVLLIDADMRRPTLHKQFGVPCDNGLSEILTRDVSFIDAMVKIEGEQLYLIPAGPVSRHASDLISIGFSSLLERAAREFDIVIVDAPPMLGLSETQELASLVDGVVVVTQAQSTTGKALAETLASLLRVRANVLGIAMNKVKEVGSGYGYQYSYTTAIEQPKPQKDPEKGKWSF